jgi:hypothetical protein
MDATNRPTANEGLLALERRTERTARPTDIRLRVLAYHVACIATLPPGESVGLHTVEGFDCRVRRTEDGNYDVDGEITGTLDDALRLFFRNLDLVATGLHSDLD